MMGRQAKQTQMWSEPVNVFARIPEDHFLRRLNTQRNLEFVRQEVAALYGRNGQVSVDPVVIMKMMLLLFLDDVKSERDSSGRDQVLFNGGSSSPASSPLRACLIRR